MRLTPNYSWLLVHLLHPKQGPHWLAIWEPGHLVAGLDWHAHSRSFSTHAHTFPRTGAARLFNSQAGGLMCSSATVLGPLLGSAPPRLNALARTNAPRAVSTPSFLPPCDPSPPRHT